MLLSRVVGQEPAVAALTRALASGRLAHAYLFDGPEGVGKRAAAVGLGLALVCAKKPRAGCGACELCARVLAGNHPDVWVFDAPALKALAQERGDVSQVEYAREHVFPYARQRPHEAAARLLVIDHADEMNAHTQNAFLKTLEEPRPDVHIALLSPAPAGLLDTIRSRAQRVRFGPLRAEAVIGILEGQGVERGRAQTVAALAGGSMARAAALAGAEEEQAAALWEAVSRLRKAAAAREVGVLFAAAQELGAADNKGRLPEILELLARFYRDALAKGLGAGELVLLGERAADVDAVARLAATPGGAPRVRRAARAVLDAQEALAANVNPVSVLERLMFEARPCERRSAA
jgi:DNA polymerase-3 subunit delta'